MIYGENIVCGGILFSDISSLTNLKRIVMRQNNIFSIKNNVSSIYGKFKLPDFCPIFETEIFVPLNDMTYTIRQKSSKTYYLKNMLVIRQSEYLITLTEWQH